MEEIKQKQEALLTASHKLSEVLYQQAQDQQQASSTGATDAESPDEDVVEDAEIIDEEDEGERK